MIAWVVLFLVMLPFLVALAIVIILGWLHYRRERAGRRLVERLRKAGGL